MTEPPGHAFPVGELEAAPNLRAAYERVRERNAELGITLEALVCFLHGSQELSMMLLHQMKSMENEARAAIERAG